MEAATDSLFNVMCQMKELDGYLPSNLEEILDKNNASQTSMASVQEKNAVTADVPSESHDLPMPISESQEVANFCIPTILLAKFR